MAQAENSDRLADSDSDISESPMDAEFGNDIDTALDNLTAERLNCMSKQQLIKEIGQLEQRVDILRKRLIPGGEGVNVVVYSPVTMQQCLQSLHSHIDTLIRKNEELTRDNEQLRAKIPVDEADTEDMVDSEPDSPFSGDSSSSSYSRHVTPCIVLCTQQTEEATTSNSSNI